MDISTDCTFLVFRDANVDQTLVFFENFTALENYHYGKFAVQDLLPLKVLHHLLDPFPINVFRTLKLRAGVRCLHFNLVKVNDNPFFVFLDTLSEFSFFVFLLGSSVFLASVFVLGLELADLFKIFDGILQVIESHISRTTPVVTLGICCIARYTFIGVK